MIRKAKVFDVPEIVLMWHDLMVSKMPHGRTMTDHDMSEVFKLITNFIDSPYHIIMVSEDNQSKLNGFVYIAISGPKINCPHLTATCDYAYASKGVRRDRIGKKLIEAGWQLARDKGCKVFEFCTIYDEHLVRRYKKIYNFTAAEILFRKMEV